MLGFGFSHAVGSNVMRVHSLLYVLVIMRVSSLMLLKLAMFVLDAS
jgi:hypothetical protein